MVQKTPTSLFRLLPLFFGSGKKNRSFKVSTSAPTRLESCDLALKLNESLVGVTKLRKNMLFQRFFFGIHPEMEVVYGGRTSQRVFFQIMKYIRFAYHI